MNERGELPILSAFSALPSQPGRPAQGSNPVLRPLPRGPSGAQATLSTQTWLDSGPGSRVQGWAFVSWEGTPELGGPGQNVGPSGSGPGWSLGQ